MNVKPLFTLTRSAAAAAGSAWTALWTFPAMLLAAFLVAWGAEAAQFLISQGLALAALAWLQTLPEFAVEAVIAWEAGQDPTRAHLAIANLTGAIRLLVGLGWPMVYFVAAYYARRRREAAGGPWFPDVVLDREHAVEVMGQVPPLLYFTVIWFKRSLSVVDAAVLLGLYAAYLWVLWQCPPQGAEHVDAAPAVARWAYRQPGARRVAAIGGLFVAGGLLLYLTAHPFLESMLALAATLGVSQFVFVQWVAPFLSEFPEKLSAFYWARRVTHAPMALMNLASSNINQWTVLAAMIPLVYGWSHALAGHGWAPFRFDAAQHAEIGLTIAQSVLAVLLLMNMRFGWLDAAALFVLWAVQFAFPSLRVAVALAYLAWGAWLVVLAAVGKQRFVAPGLFVDVLRENRARRRRTG